MRRHEAASRRTDPVLAPVHVFKPPMADEELRGGGASRGGAYSKMGQCRTHWALYYVVLGRTAASGGTVGANGRAAGATGACHDHGATTAGQPWTV